MQVDKELLNAVLNCYRNPETHVVMMENHGVFVIGKNLHDLLYKAEVWKIQQELHF